MKDADALIKLGAAYDSLSPDAKKLVRTELKREYAGQRHDRNYEWAGLTVGSLLGGGGLVGSFWIIATSDSWAAATGGAAVGVGDFIALAAIFLLGTQKRADLAESLRALRGKSSPPPPVGQPAIEEPPEGPQA